MKNLFAVILFLTSTTGSIADQSKIKKLMSRLDCKTSNLSPAHSQADLLGLHAVWMLINVGPASAVIRTKSDPIFNKVIEPYTEGSDVDTFIGDIRYRYTIGLTMPGTKTKVHVCIAPPALLKLSQHSYNQGLALSKKGQYDEAILKYTKAIEINSRYALAYLHRGLAYEKKGQYDHAVSDFTKTLKINPRNDDAYYNRGSVSEQKGQYDQAIADYTKAIEINPGHGWAFGNRGNMYLNKGLTDQAILDFTKSILIYPNFEVIYYLRGLAYQDKEQYDQAISDFIKAIKITPESSVLGQLPSEKLALTYTLRGKDFNEKGQYDHAISDYTKSIEAFPGEAYVYLLRGFIYTEKGQHKLALDDYKKAKSLGWEILPEDLKQMIEDAGE